MKTILVTGGAGYIGAHAVHALKKAGDYKIVVVDNFSQSRKNIIDDPAISYHQSDIRNKSALMDIFASVKPDAVMHFAALASVPDSIIKPFEYYENNVVGGLNVLECMRAHKTKYIVFSSSASVYGEPQSATIKEDHQKYPTNPYGYTKLLFEIMLKNYFTAYGISSISLRYFCAAGCDNEAKLGEYHTPETHAIPCIVQTLLGQRSEFTVFGDDYSTPDGSGIRDYIHVSDLATAHTLSMKRLFEQKTLVEQYNLGINKGFSVFELIKTAEKISGKKVVFTVKARRPGDPSSLVADSTAAQINLNWKPIHTDIKDMVSSSYEFFKNIK